jgi:hypothetical protein
MQTLIPTEPSVATAINIIQTITDTNGPQCAAFFVGPNMILTLAGARMFGDGVFYHPDSATLKTWSHEISQGLQCIQSQTKSPFFAEIANNSIDHSDLGNIVYSLYSIQGFINTLPSYSFLDPQNYGNLLHEPSTNKKPYRNFLDMLGKLDDFKKYDSDQIMHIAFGVYLGYPEKAIFESLQFWNDSDGKLANMEVLASIKGANYYRCPQPIYTYPRDLINNPDIINHETLWSGILQEFYSSDLHKQLQKDHVFSKTIEEIGKY